MTAQCKAVLRRGLLLLVGLVIAVLALTEPAAAATGAECAEPPVATAPSEQAPAATLGAVASAAPTGADPFADDAATTIYQEYGWPTTWWTPYDLGCGAQMANDPIAVLATFFANLLALVVLAGGALFDVVVHATLGWSGLGLVDTTLDSVVADLRGQVWLPAMTLVSLAVALWFVVHAVRGDTRKIAFAAGWSAAAVLLIGAIVSYPTRSAQLFDNVVSSAVTTAYGEDGGADGAVARVYEVGLYRPWCEGMVGSSADAARRWCPSLWKATFLSATEAETSGSARVELLAEKKKEFDRVAAGIKEQDPAAYRVLQGRDWSTRLIAAGVAGVVVAVLVFFPISAALVLLTALLMLRAAVFLAPVVGPVLVHPAARRAGQGLLRLLGGAAINAVVFAFASAVYLRIVAATVTAESPPLVVRMLILAVLSAALWVLTRPWRRVSGLGRGLATTISRSGSRSEHSTAPPAASAPGVESPGSVGAGSAAATIPGHAVAEHAPVEGAAASAEPCESSAPPFTAVGVRTEDQGREHAPVVVLYSARRPGVSTEPRRLAVVPAPRERSEPDESVTALYRPDREPRKDR
jgi:hypothetical protein